MADGIYTEAVKFWGGLAGLGTAAFTIWDRVLRGRPWMEPHVVAVDDGRSHGMLSIDAPMYLRIHNPGRHAVGIGTLRLWGAGTKRVELVADVGREVHPKRLLPIGPENHRLLELMWVDPEVGEDVERPFWIVVSWRPFKALLPRPPLLLRTSLAALIRQQEDELQLQKEDRQRRR